MTLRVLDPTPERPTTLASRAPGLATLRGATVGILDNGKIPVERFCDFVERILRSDHGVADVVRRRKRNASAPVSEADLSALLATDAVISAVGD